MKLQEWLGVENKLGQDIWEKKYKHGNESFDKWLDRVSNGNEKLKQMIIDKKFLFGGRILSNRGLQKDGLKVTYSNCYVITPPEDNIESIFTCASNLARTYSYGGGCGINIGKLSPRGAKVNNTAKETSGAVSFMDLYSMVTGLIGQNGRRGALMISLPCNHPDLEEFIDLKSDLDRVTKANISIMITNDFMNAVTSNSQFKLSFKREETGEEIYKTVDAKKIFNKLCKMNWDYAEPGMLYWDNINNYNLLSEDDSFEYAGTNPCAEEPLPAGGSCLLGSINLSAFVKEDKTFDMEDFKTCVMQSVTALNEVLDEGLPLHPLKEQRDSVRDWRQIGLGILGLADMLINMEIEYGSKESIELCDKIGFEMANASLLQSSILSYEYGESYPRYRKECILQSSFLNKNTSNLTIEYIKRNGLRNSQILTIAPTGSISTMIGVSGGLEPIFANYYTRKTESLHGHDEYYKVYTKIVEDYMKKNNINDETMLPNFFVTAQTLNFKNRIDMQATWQKHIDASISSTVNVPHDFTVEDVQELYIYAWQKNLKGVTIYRDGCKRNGILTMSNDIKDKDNKKEEFPRGTIIKADDNCIGRKRSLRTGCGTLHCEAFFDPISGELLETYLSKGSTGGCNNFMIALSRMISIASRGGVDIYSIADQLNSSGVCPSYAVRSATKKDTSKGSSCPVAIGNVLIDMYKEVQSDLFEININDKDTKQQIKKENIIDNNKLSIKCPECGEPLAFEGGCSTCKACGWTKCD